MKKHSFFPTLLLIVSFLSLFACSRSEEKSLAYTSASFTSDVTAVCRSKEPNKTLLFIGLENGELVIRDIQQDTQQVIKVGHGRLYDVYELNPSTLLVGVRNEGLKVIKNGQLTEHTFTLKGNEEKSTNYSLYSIAGDEKQLYFGTSNGAYSLSVDSLDTKELIPYGNISSPNHYAVNKVICSKGSVFLATDSALIVNNSEKISNKTIRTIIENNNDIYACVKGHEVVEITNKQNYNGLVASEEELYGYFKDEWGGKWYIKNNAVRYTPPQKDHVKKANSDVLFELPQELNIDGKQIVCPHDGFLSITCGNQLISFSIHQNIVGDNENVMVVSHNAKENITYYITRDHVLHKYEDADSYISYAIGKIKGLDISSKIIGSFSVNNKIWLVTHKKVSIIDIRHKRVIDELLLDSNNNDFRIIYHDYDRNILYLGTRLNLCYISTDKIRPAINKKDILKSPDTDLYVTSIYSDNKAIYVGTLNKGLFKIEADTTLWTKPETLIQGCEEYGNIRSLYMQNESLRVHTSKGIYKYHSPDSMEITFEEDKIRNIKRVSSHNSYIAFIGYYGFKFGDKFNDVELSYRDMSFNQAGIAISNNSLIIGNKFGLFVQDIKGFHKIEMYEKNNSIWIAIGVSIILLIIIIGFIYYKRYVYRKQIQRYKKRVKEYRSMVQGQVLKIDDRNKLSEDLDEIEKDISLIEDKYIVQAKPINELHNRLNSIKSNIRQKSLTISEIGSINKDNNEPIVDRKKLASKYELSDEDLIVLEVLSDSNHPEKEKYLIDNIKSTDKRQAKISKKLGLKENSRYYLVAKAFRLGLLK